MMDPSTLLSLAAVGALLSPSAPAATQDGGQDVLLEAEAFDSLGGWVLDQQFMDLMGSPFLLAHGMGVPVEDATTRVDLPRAGTYRVWVRTRDWVAPWGKAGAPGRFEVRFGGEPLGVTFGTEGAEWHWQDGGTVELAGSVSVALHDLTGFEGRCDALLLSPRLDWTPPDGDDLGELRRSLRGLPAEPVEAGVFDLVVVGGGTAGTAAAVSAARLGLTVALVQDRPVLGGNASSEVRVWPEGHVNLAPFPRVGDVVMELVPERRADSKNAQGAHVFDDDRKLGLARAEPNITLFLENRMNGAEAVDDSIRAVLAEHVRSAVRTRIQGRWFLDSTGDGSLGFLVGADFEQTERGHMGASNLWNIQCLCEDEEPLSSELEAACELAVFPRCPWAVDLAERPFPGRDWGAKEPTAGTAPISLGNWYWENGFDRDPIHDMERIRDQNFRAMYGAWDAIKNVERRYPAHRLGWVAYIAGKRESRRLMGDVILTGEDLRDGVEYPDGCFPCTWGIDTHHPNPAYAEGHDGDEFIADYTHGEGYVYDGPYWAPYRCLYSRNVSNLFMAGRDISVSHEALGAVRVMKTTGTMGEIVGMAASLCKAHDCGPREVYAEHLGELQGLMRLGVGRVPSFRSAADGSFQLAAKAARTQGTAVRYEANRDALGYWRHEGDSCSWALDVATEGRYSVELLLSCEMGEEGGEVAVRIDGAPGEVRAEVPSTGGWDRYELVKLPALVMAPGKHTLRVANRKAEGPLMKLREVRLVPLR